MSISVIQQNQTMATQNRAATFYDIAKIFNVSLFHQVRQSNCPSKHGQKAAIRGIVVLVNMK
jgi:hypothetical protein